MTLKLQRLENLQRLEIVGQEFTCRHKGGFLSIQHLLLRQRQSVADDGVVIEMVAQLLIDCLIHPVFRLLIAAIFKVTISLDKRDILVNHIPYLLDTQAIESAIAQHFGLPSALMRREEMEGVAETRCSEVAAIYIVTIALVDDDAIADFHDNTSALFSVF